MPVVGAIDSVFIPRILTQLRPPPFPIIGSVAERAQAVVIGGGITGASVAYHLAKAGLKDTLLLDKGELTSGSTCHAAGLVTQFNPSPTMMRFRRYSIELYRELGVFETVGSLRFASTKEQLMELQRGVSRARGIRAEEGLVAAAEAARRRARQGKGAPQVGQCCAVQNNAIDGRAGPGGVWWGGWGGPGAGRGGGGGRGNPGGVPPPPARAGWDPVLRGAARRFPFL